MWNNGTFSAWTSYHHTKSACIADLGGVEAILSITLFHITLIISYTNDSQQNAFWEMLIQTNL